MISRFSAFFSSAAFVKLNCPVITISSSMIMILLWAMACLASMYVGIAILRKVAEEYFCPLAPVEDDLNLDPPLVGLSRALAMGAESKRIGLDEDLLLGLAEGLIDCIGTAPIRTEIDLDGGIFGEGEVGGMS